MCHLANGGLSPLYHAGKEAIMSGNVGNIDRVLRFLIGAALIFAPLIDFMGLGASQIGVFAMIIVGGILVLTALFGVCPLYSVLGIKTRS
jgi:hypothetical protein